MDGFAILLFVVAAIVSIIGEAGKKKNKPPPVPRRRVPPSRQDPAPRAPGPLPLPQQHGQPQGRAADMIPDDFWRELTGQPPREPAPVATLPPPEPPSWDEEAIARAEAENRALQTRPEARSLEDYRRAEVKRKAPAIVNLEASVPTTAQRHEAFHRRIDAANATSVPTTPVIDPGSLLGRLRTRNGAQEALLYAEIFGPPGGLEHDPFDR